MERRGDSLSSSVWEYKLLSIDNLSLGEVHRLLANLKGRGWTLERVICEEQQAQNLGARCLLLKRRTACRADTPSAVAS